MGHSRRFDRPPTTSGLPRLADVLNGIWHVSKVPTAEVDGPIRSTRQRAAGGIKARQDQVCWLFSG
jgi:hypothetical protein